MRLLQLRRQAKTNFPVETDAIRETESVLTVVDGRIACTTRPFAVLDPEMPPVSPDRYPATRFGGYDDRKPPGRRGGRDREPGVHRNVPSMGADGRVWETGCGCGV